MIRVRLVTERIVSWQQGDHWYSAPVPAPWWRWRLRVERPAKVLADGSLRGWTELGATDDDS